MTQHELTYIISYDDYRPGQRQSKQDTARVANRADLVNVLPPGIFNNPLVDIQSIRQPRTERIKRRNLNTKRNDNDNG